MGYVGGELVGPEEVVVGVGGLAHWLGWLREFVVEGGHGGEGLQLVVGVSFARWRFGVGLNLLW